MILVVDDEPYITRSLEFILKKAGYDVATATNGEDALSAVRVAQPRLMFLDIMMPRKNGYDVCREIKGDPDLTDIYIIMLTAKGQGADREQGLIVGADEFITKPFSPSQVLTRVRELLG